MARRVSQISAHETVAIPNDLTDEQFEGEFVILIPLYKRLFECMPKYYNNDIIWNVLSSIFQYFETKVV